MDFIPRVIAGSAKGIALKAPKGRNTRPTTDRTKEALFSIILPYIDESRVLDLFAGTGGFGIEALSRGASFATFVDSDKKSINFIYENLKSCGFRKNYKVVLNKVDKMIDFLGRKNQKFDIIFMDPPYNKGFVVNTIENICKNDIIKSGSIVICEHDQDEIIPDEIENLICIDRRKYGIANIAIFRHK